MVARKWWTGQIFSAGYRAGARPSIDPPGVGITISVTSRPETGRKIDVVLTPKEARDWAAAMLKAAYQVEEEITRSAITRDVMRFAGGQT